MQPGIGPHDTGVFRAGLCVSDMTGLNPFNYPERYYHWFLLMLGAVFFFPFLGYLHLFDWDEINFAESSREMLVSGDYFHVLINYMPFWEKPPLFMWLQASSMSLFGVSEFAARFPNALFGLISLYSIYRIGQKHISASFGLTWGLLYLMSFLPHVYFKSGIIDPVFNYFIFMSIYYLVRTLNQGRAVHALAGGTFAGLAFLTKGPVGILIILLTYLSYFAFRRFRNMGKPAHILLFTFSAALVSFTWILPEFIRNGWSTLSDFIQYQLRLFSTGDAGHSQPFFYHFIVVFVGCFPMSLFALPLFSPGRFTAPMNYTRWMCILFWVVMILFSIVKTKIVHYSSMCWLPMSFCAAILVYQKMQAGRPESRLSRVTFLTGGLLFSFLLAVVPLIGYFRQELIPYIKDSFAAANLQLPVDWHPAYALIGLFFALAVIMGYLWLGKALYKRFLIAQALATGITLFAYLLLVVPRIEQHSQRTAILFYKSLAGKDVYVHIVGFKSYAHWFYFQVPQTNNAQRQDQRFLLEGPIDKPVYLVTKIADNLLDNKENERIYFLKAQGGFKFYVRKPAP